VLRGPSPSSPPVAAALTPAAALGTVIDPELGIDIVSLGLVYGLRVEAGRIEVDLTMTTPACPVIGYLLQEVEAALQPLSDDVHVELVWQPPWSPLMLSPELRARRGLPRPDRSPVFNR
jgi:metal-sulfur cluster biosynthetic enzyme